MGWSDDCRANARHTRPNGPPWLESFLAFENAFIPSDDDAHGRTSDHVQKEEDGQERDDGESCFAFVFLRDTFPCEVD